MSEDDREVVDAALAEVGLDSDERFVDVVDGEKKCLDHDTRYASPPSGNYGIYATAGDQLVLLDVDDYDEIDDRTGLDAVEGLRDEHPTLTQVSPHGGAHLIFKVRTDQNGRLPSHTLEKRVGTANPNPSWGEVRTMNQYVVGAGSQLDGCGKDGCSACADPDGGRYTVPNARPIATIDAATLVETLLRDPDLGTDDEQGALADARERDENGASGGGDPAGEVEEVLAYALDESDDDRLRGLWRDATLDGDRSRGECALALKVGWWIGGGRTGQETRRIVAEVFEGRHTPDGWRDPSVEKWRQRTDDTYRDSVLDAVSIVDDPFNPDAGGGRAATDGGAATVDAPTVDDLDDEAPPPLAPEGVMKHAFADTYGRLSRSPDDEDPTVHDLRKSETAAYTWDLLEERGDDDVIAVTDGTLRAFDGDVWVREGKQRLREHGERALRPAYSSRVHTELEETCRARHTYHVDELGIAEPWVVLRDGSALNLETRETRDVERDDLALRKIDVGDPTDSEPGLWLDFLADVAASPKTIEKLQEYLGYCLWHHSQPFGKALFLVGPTDSGKGTVLKTIQAILGEENVASQSLKDLVETRWGRAHLFGKMVNIRNEITPGSIQDVNTFKELTGGGDRVSAEFKGEQKFEFVVNQKFLFATNQFPDFEQADAAFWNRCLFARFPETIPDEDQVPEFHDRLLDEREAILNWMLDGLDRLRDRGRFTGERDLDKKQNIAEESGDALDRFKQTALEITGEQTHLVHARDLYDFATAFADSIGMENSLPPYQGGSFTMALKEWPGIGTMESRRVVDSGKANAFTGLRIDSEVATELGVDVRTDDQTGGSQTSL